MFNFLKDIGVGIAAAFTAFVGVFQPTPEPTVVIPVEIVATSTIEVSTTTVKVKEKQTEIKKQEVKKVAPDVQKVTIETITGLNIFIAKVDEHIYAGEKDLTFYESKDSGTDLSENKRLLRSHLTYLKTTKYSLVSIRDKAMSNQLSENEANSQSVTILNSFSSQVLSFQKDSELAIKKSIQDYADELDDEARRLKNELDNYQSSNNQAVEDAKVRQDLYYSIVGQGNGVPQTIIDAQLRAAGF